MKTIGMVLALLSPVALAEFVPTEPISTDSVVCTMDASTIEVEQTKAGPIVAFAFGCVNKLTRDVGSEKVIVLCESGEIATLAAATMDRNGQVQPAEPTERRGIVVGSPLHKMANKVCGYAYARATQGAGYARGLGRN